MTKGKQHSGIDRELIHVITSLPVDIERLAEMLDAGADSNAIIIDNERDLNVLQYVSLYGHIEAVQLLLDHGADVDARGHNRAMHTALGISCDYGHTEIVRLLLEHGADVSKTDNNKRTPLHKTAIKGRQEIARVLIEHGASVNIKDHWGYTPLHLACLPGRPGIVRVLLEAMADVTIRDWEGNTPLDDVMSLSVDIPAREEIIELFRQYAPEMVMEKFCTMEVSI